MKKSDVSRFKDKIIPQGECLIFNGFLNKAGYGRFWVNRKPLYAHRFSYMAFRGPLEPGKVIMHSCDNPSCVNPKHLKQSSQGKNLLDCSKKGRNYYLSKSHCPRNHPYSGDNLYITPKGHRQCRDCKKISKQKWQERHNGN